MRNFRVLQRSIWCMAQYTNTYTTVMDCGCRSKLFGFSCNFIARTSNHTPTNCKSKNIQQTNPTDSSECEKAKESETKIDRMRDHSFLYIVENIINDH